MPYTIEDFRRDYAREHLKMPITPQEILTAVAPEETSPGDSRGRPTQGHFR